MIIRTYVMGACAGMLAVLSLGSLHGSPKAPPRTLPAAAEDEVGHFSEWLTNYAHTSESHRQNLAAQALAIARERKGALLSLIETDPRRAIQCSIPPSVRNNLPQDIRPLVEEHVSLRGSMHVIAVTLEPNATGAFPPVIRTVKANGKTYRAFVSGKMLQQPTRDDIPIRGIVLDGNIALAEDPLRILSPDEAAPFNQPGTCFICQRSGTMEAAAELGGSTYRFCGSAHLGQFQTQMTSQNMDKIVRLPVQWTTGRKTLLFMRVDFSDAPGGMTTDEEARAIVESADRFFRENSYGAFSLSGTATPVLRMPAPRASYGPLDFNRLLNDARIVAAAQGFDTAAYDFDVVQYVPRDEQYTGMGNLGWKGAWALRSDAGVVHHELGHNLGIMHANIWKAAGDSVVGPGTHEEYGNWYETMGMSTSLAQFNVCHKTRLNWFPDWATLGVTTSGVYRLHAFDADALTTNRAYALKIHKDAERDFWIEHRKKRPWFFPSLWINDGVLVNWNPWSQSAGGTHLLHPLSDPQNAGQDRVLVLGKTLSDPEAQVHITPVRKSADDEWVDIAVHFGPFPSNRPPVASISASVTNVPAGQLVQFSVNAVDPDGDTLGYYWDFGLDEFKTRYAANNPAPSYRWVNEGERSVLCIISDMKGGFTVKSLLVRVGKPVGTRISGRVTRRGEPVTGAYVFFPEPEGVVRASTWSDDSGRFVLTGVNPRRQQLAAMQWTNSFYLMGSPEGWVPATNNVDGLHFVDAAVELAAPQPQNGGWRLGANVIPGVIYALEASTNLLDWVPVEHTISSNEAIQFFDPEPSPRRFYRVRKE